MPDTNKYILNLARANKSSNLKNRCSKYTTAARFSSYSIAFYTTKTAWKKGGKAVEMYIKNVYKTCTFFSTSNPCFGGGMYQFLFHILYTVFPRIYPRVKWLCFGFNVGYITIIHSFPYSNNNHHINKRI